MPVKSEVILILWTEILESISQFLVGVPAKIAVSEAVGIPLSQLAANFQEVLVPPTHVFAAAKVLIVTKNDIKIKQKTNLPIIVFLKIMS